MITTVNFRYFSSTIVLALLILYTFISNKLVERSTKEVNACICLN